VACRSCSHLSTELSGLDVSLCDWRFIALLAACLAGVSLPFPAKARTRVRGKAINWLLDADAGGHPARGLFFVYVGTENLWEAGWRRSERIVNRTGTLWVTTPSFFYGALLLGRAAGAHRSAGSTEVKLARWAWRSALLGVVGLLASGRSREFW